MPATNYAQVLAADAAANVLSAIAATDPLSLSGINSCGILSLHVRSRCSGAAIYRRGGIESRLVGDEERSKQPLAAMLYGRGAQLILVAGLGNRAGRPHVSR
jgi:hypothetical protein